MLKCMTSFLRARWVFNAKVYDFIPEVKVGIQC